MRDTGPEAYQARLPHHMSARPAFDTCVTIAAYSTIREFARIRMSRGRISGSAYRLEDISSPRRTVSPLADPSPPTLFSAPAVPMRD